MPRAPQGAPHLDSGQKGLALPVVNLTKRKIESLPTPKSGRKEYRDEKKPGLSLLIGHNGKRYWYWRRRIDGQVKRKKIGDYPDLTPEQAKKEADVLNARRATGEPIEGRNSEMQLELLWEEYLERHAKQHKKTWKEDQNQWRRYLKRWKKKTLSAVSRADVTKWHSRLKKNHGKYAANRALALLRKMYNFAINTLDWDGKNPCQGVKLFKEEERDRFLSEDELKTLWDVLETEEPIFRDFFRILLLAGQRCQNTLEMRWDEIDFQNETWRIPDTKSGSSQLVPLPPEAVQILNDRHEIRENEYVFASYGKTGHLTYPKTAWKRICKKAGFTDARIHDLRRTLGSYALISGVSLPKIGKMLGHKSLQSTKIYARLNQGATRQAHEAATASMIKIVSRSSQNDE